MLTALALTFLTLSPSVDSRAAALYEEGLKHYNVAEYEQAIDRFKQAYLLTRAPELLFNIAQAYRLWGNHCDLALQSYRSYLREDPKSPKRAKVDGYLAELEKCPAPTADPPAPQPPPEPVIIVQQTVTERPTPALILAGGGALLALTGGALMGWARLDYDGFVKAQCSPMCDPSRTGAAKLRQSVGVGLVVSGAVIAAAALVWWFLGGKEVLVTPGGAGGTW